MLKSYTGEEHVSMRWITHSCTEDKTLERNYIGSVDVFGKEV